MKTVHYLIAAGLLLANLTGASAQMLSFNAPARGEEPNNQVEPAADYRGWDYLAKKLLRDGVDHETVAAIFQNPSMPPFEKVPFALNPHESRQQYRSFLLEARLNTARSCLTNHAAFFEHAEKTFSVDRHVIAAILLVETHCGRVTGSSTVINRVSRVASVADPKNLEFNIRRLQAENPEVSAAEIKKRSQYLEDMFYPEVLALIKIAKESNSDIFTYRGSHAGAFGFSQFMPSTYLKFAVDGDGDGKVSLYSMPDATASIANFLSSYGWQDNASPITKRQVIWRYNHSPAYVDAVLKVAEQLQTRPEIQLTARKSPPKKSKPAKKGVKRVR